MRLNKPTIAIKRKFSPETRTDISIVDRERDRNRENENKIYEIHLPFNENEKFHGTIHYKKKKKTSAHATPGTEPF